jgi:hypothetical protein
VISGQVFDAIYYSQPVPNARVSLYNRGVLVDQTFASVSGTFAFSELASNSACVNYRLIIDSYVDNPCTGGTNSAYQSENPTGCNSATWQSYYPNLADESEYGGYWPYESKSFSVGSFRTTGIENSSGRIFLAPRVGPGETLVVNTFNGGSVVDAHLVLPPALAFRRTGDGSNASIRSDDTWEFCSPSDTTCRKTLNWQGGWGRSDLNEIPHGSLYCINTAAGRPPDDCMYFDTPQTMKYKRVDAGLTGLYSYFLVDYFANGSSPPNTFRAKRSQVRVITQDRLYTINAPAGNATCTHDPAPTLPDPNPSTSFKEGVDQPPDRRGKFWLVFQQDAATGAITVPADSVALRCFGDDPLTGHSVELPAPLGEVNYTYQ